VGRALAYELPTACGFHTFRVTEAVVRRYWDAVSENKERPKPQTLGTFAAKMAKHKYGDEKVVEAIKQMTKLHRNPLIHPEVILNVEEAIGIIGMARSVIAMMLQAYQMYRLRRGPSLPLLRKRRSAARYYLFENILKCLFAFIRGAVRKLLANDAF
jgi:hypothetical protein